MPRLVASHDPLVLLIGAGRNLGVLAGARVSAFAVVPHDGSNKVEESDQGGRAEDPPRIKRGVESDPRVRRRADDTASPSLSGFQVLSPPVTSS